MEVLREEFLETLQSCSSAPLPPTLLGFSLKFRIAFRKPFMDITSH